MNEWASTPSTLMTMSPGRTPSAKPAPNRSTESAMASPSKDWTTCTPHSGPATRARRLPKAIRVIQRPSPSPTRARRDTDTRLRITPSPTCLAPPLRPGLVRSWYRQHGGDPKSDGMAGCAGQLQSVQDSLGPGLGLSLERRVVLDLAQRVEDLLSVVTLLIGLDVHTNTSVASCHSSLSIGGSRARH